MMHRIVRRAGALSALALAAVALWGCESTTAPQAEPLNLLLESPEPGAKLYSTSAAVVGRVLEPVAPVVTYSVNGSPFAPVTVASDGQFVIDLATAPAGAVSLVVRGQDGARTGEVTREFELVALTITLDNPSAGETLYGRVVSFGGQLSVPLTVRTSLNGGAERAVQQYPPMPGGGPSPFRARVHPLADGLNKVLINYYDGTRLVSQDSFEVTAEVPELHYSVVEIDMPLGPVTLPSYITRFPLLSNDGRIVSGGHTWKLGTLTQLTAMSVVHDLNNAGQVLGNDASGNTLVWDDGTYTEVPGFPNATRINDNGDLVRSGAPGFWDGTTFVPYSGSDFVIPSDINNSRQVVGNVLAGLYHSARLWLAPPAMTIHAPHRETVATRVSESGHVLIAGTDPPPLAATPEFSQVLHYFVASGTIVLLNDHVGFRVVAGDVNASGTVAGTYEVDGKTRGFTWRDGRTTDVVLATDAHTLEAVTSINDHGQLAAIATRKSDGKQLVLLLTPQ